MNHYDIRGSAISQEQYDELKLELEQLKEDFYFDMRNKQIEIETLKNQLREVTNEKNNKKNK